MLNQNNSQSFLALNRSLTNKNNLNELLEEIKEFAQISLLKNYSFEKINEVDQNSMEMINETYQLKKLEREQNQSQNSSRILPNVLSKQKSEESLGELKDVNILTSITKINLTLNDNKIISDQIIKIRETSQTQRNLNSIRIIQQHSKTQPRFKCLTKKLKLKKIKSILNQISYLQFDKNIITFNKKRHKKNICIENLIDNMKNENTILNKDKYLINCKL
ncbi:unnamed protein product [Paramecium sonneborni]|uniref:Uncharacterized protein n=1 Tax=Paramecium sonneborni TaxID=65129 RepID=A0A8S1NG39_9CILI|nr:unnamed protein product [Paramecium sonneborni]